MLETTVVGSYPQPDWLINRERLREGVPPRVPRRDLWRVAEPFLREAQDDATLVALRDMERAGIDVVSDGEIRRESYSSYFATRLDGLDCDNPGTAVSRTGREVPVPRVVGELRHAAPVDVSDVEFLRASTGRRIRFTVPGPYTLTCLSQDDFYGDPEALAFAYADAVNAELQAAAAAGADVVQIDEPYLQARPEEGRAYGLAAVDRALAGIAAETALHTCFGYGYVVHEKPHGYPLLGELATCAAAQISIETAQPRLDLSVLEALADKTVVLGVLDLADAAPVETADGVARRAEEALAYVLPERLVLAPDCGMKYLSRGRALAKLQALAAGAALVTE